MSASEVALLSGQEKGAKVFRFGGAIRMAAGLVWVAASLLALIGGPTSNAATFASRATSAPEIYVMNADGSGKTALTRNEDGDDAPAWSPDGTKIAISSERDESWEIYVLNADGSAPSRLTVNRSADDAFPDWSPDGTKIAFETDRDDDYEIYVMNADGSGQTNLTRESQTEDHTPVWSPDGTKIAFGSEGDIYVMNADGSGQTRITRDSQYDVFPDWSPDGSKIAVTGGSTATGFIDVVNADGSGRTRLTHGGREYFPDWSRDGTKIAYTVASTGTGEIWVMNADGSAPTNLTLDPRRGDYEPSWSPDGTKIVYATSLDKLAPEIGLAARPRQPVGKQKGVIVKVSCDEACTLRASGTITIAGQRAKVRLKRASGRLNGPGRKVVKLALSRSAAQRVARLIAQGKSARAVISARAVDLAGNAGTAKRTFTLRR
jgi:Tol biopolymer transport system component